MNKLDNVMDKVEETLCTVLTCVMSLAILVQVVNRNTIKLPFPWGEELARYCMVWLTMVGISAGVKKGSHIGVDALINVLPAGAKRGIQILTNILVTVIYGYMTVLAVQITMGIQETGQVSPAMGVPMFIIYSGLIVGMAFSTIRSIQVTAKLAAGKEPAAENAGGDLL